MEREFASRPSIAGPTALSLFVTLFVWLGRGEASDLGVPSVFALGLIAGYSANWSP
jgi:hypothetical protein